ncbi:MAG: hypothetical protein KDA86_07665 [Planctomycetaceae bacterium]|nr:hypothetical protein [Planctomycetaceae bacterium]
MTKTPVHQRSDRRGLSLMDLVITVLIMSILSAVAAPRFSSTLNHYSAETAAQQLCADLNYARQYARQTSQEILVQFTQTPPGYTLTGVPSLDKSGNDFSVDLVDLGYNVTLPTVDFDGELGLRFNPYGRPLVADGSAALSSGTVIVRAGSDITTVLINIDNGKAEVQ